MGISNDANLGVAVYYVKYTIARQNTRERLGVNDVRRAEIAIKGFRGKRLTYQTTANS